MNNTGMNLLISAFPGLSVQKTVGPPWELPDYKNPRSNLSKELLTAAFNGNTKKE